MCGGMCSNHWYLKGFRNILSRTWLKYYFFAYLFIYVFKYLFKENVFMFELCVMRVVSVACKFSVVVRAVAARWQGLVGLLEQ